MSNSQIVELSYSVVKKRLRDDKRYNSGKLRFDVAKRHQSNVAHQPLFVLLRDNDIGLTCSCNKKAHLHIRRPDLYEKLFVLALNPNSGPQHSLDCPLRSTPRTSHKEDAVKVKDDRFFVKTSFFLGAGNVDPHVPVDESRAMRDCTYKNEEKEVAFNEYGPYGLLAFIFETAKLNHWDKSQGALRKTGVSPNWYPFGMRSRLKKTIADRFVLEMADWIVCDSPEPRMENGKNIYFDVGNYLVIGPLVSINPPDGDWRSKINPNYWWIHLAKWGDWRFFLPPIVAKELLMQIGSSSENANALLAPKPILVGEETKEVLTPILVGPATEKDSNNRPIWWLGLAATFTYKGWRATKTCALRCDIRGIPADSSCELLMANHLVAADKTFLKPLFPGEIVKMPTRKPDYVILDDNGDRKYVEVAGMRGFTPYDERDDLRLGEYEKNGFTPIVWNAWDNEPFPAMS